MTVLGGPFGRGGAASVTAERFAEKRARFERLLAVSDEDWMDADSRRSCARESLELLAEVERLQESIKTIIKEDGVVVSRQQKEVDRLRETLRAIADLGNNEPFNPNRAYFAEVRDIARKALDG